MNTIIYSYTNGNSSNSYGHHIQEVFPKPIIPKIKKAAIKFGTTPIKDNLIFLNKTINIENSNHNKSQSKYL